MIAQKFSASLRSKSYQAIKPLFDRFRRKPASDKDDQRGIMGSDRQERIKVNPTHDRESENTLTKNRSVGMTGEVLSDEAEVTKRVLRADFRGQANEHWLIKIVKGSEMGRQYLATTPEVRIGRKIDNQIYLRDLKVSRYHALLIIRDSRLFVKDLKSTNGTKLNDAAVKGIAELFPGDRLQMGETIIEIQKLQ